VGLIGVLSHLIVYLISQKLLNRFFTIAVIAQGTIAIYRVSYSSDPKCIIIGLNEVGLARDDLGKFAQNCKSQREGEFTLTTIVESEFVIQASTRESTDCWWGFGSPDIRRLQWSSMASGCTVGSHRFLGGIRPL